LKYSVVAISKQFVTRQEEEHNIEVLPLENVIFYIYPITLHYSNENAGVVSYLKKRKVDSPDKPFPRVWLKSS